VRSLEKYIHKIVRKLALELVRNREVHPAAETVTSETATSETPVTETVTEKSVTGSDVPTTVVEAERSDWTVTAENLHKYVGKPVFTSDRLYEDHLPVSCCAYLYMCTRTYLQRCTTHSSLSSLLCCVMRLMSSTCCSMCN
jgi:ATP-dependent Lon protease